MPVNTLGFNQVGLKLIAASQSLQANKGLLAQSTNGKKKSVGPVGPPPLLWQTNRLTTGINFTAGSASFTSSNVAGDGNGVFTGVLPAYSFYVDVTLAEGYSSHVGFLGISNSNTAFTVGNGYPFAVGNGSFYKAWYWSGNWVGDGAFVVNVPGTLTAGTYRIGINYTNNNLYIKQDGNAIIAQSAFTLGANYYLMMMGQSGYNVPGVTILNGGTIAGAGGLY